MATARYGFQLSPAEIEARQRRHTRLALKEQRAAERIQRRESRELQRAAARDFRASELARKRELAAFKRLAKRFKIKVKRPGHGLKKQIASYRPEIETYRYRLAQKRQDEAGMLQAEYDAYAVKIDQMGKEHKGGVENPGGLFLSLTDAQKQRIMREAEALHVEYIVGGHKPLGRQYDPLFAYH